MSHEHWVPTEIIVEILLKLPVKSLLRFKCVRKQWYSLISNQRFIKSHLTLAPCNTHYRIVSFDNHSKSFRLYDHVMLGKSAYNVIELDNPFEITRDDYASICGSCNGLLCIILSVYFIFIWNPSTRELNKLPWCGFNGKCGSYLGFGFGYDESSDDYKVLGISGLWNHGTKAEVKIYSLKSGYWKTLGNFPRGLPRQALGMFFNGALHWMTECKGSQPTTIVSFDLATETFGEILQPVYDEGHNYLTLCTLGEWLSVVCDYPGDRSDIWVMKVYGVQDSWTKLFSIPHITNIKIPKDLMALCITHDGKCLLKLEKELVLYDPKNGSFSEIQKIDEYFTVNTFVESLVSPMPFVTINAM
ncbi:F-box associated interaction domain-containing protein [Artemisia annua]|uniref:F-box associated interaction domain-containing protein n=1 Tax=Artemisia annua TaxID=35608 RepID=A0A2U1PUT5_ARTAN|nr:F-box associated interaction domain-containing protein [Artemisia annua]